jgi:hypothetical protein
VLRVLQQPLHMPRALGLNVHGERREEGQRMAGRGAARGGNRGSAWRGARPASG